MSSAPERENTRIKKNKRVAVMVEGGWKRGVGERKERKERKKNSRRQ